MLAKAGADANPDMKNKVASFSGKLCTVLQKKVGSYMNGIVEALVTNLQH